MFRNIKIQISIMLRKKGFQFSFLSMLLLVCAAYLQYAFRYYKIEKSLTEPAYEMMILNDMSNYYGIFMQIFLFIIVFPYCTAYFSDRTTGMEMMMKSRTNIRKYYYSQCITCFIGAFIIIFVPLFIQDCLIYTTFTDFSYSHFMGGPYSEQYSIMIQKFPFFQLFLKSTFLYYMIYSIWAAFIGGIGAVFAYSFSFIIQKFAVLLLVPFYAVVTFMESLMIVSEQGIISTALQDYLTVATSIKILSYKGLLFFCFFIVIFSVIVMELKIKRERRRIAKWS